MMEMANTKLIKVDNWGIYFLQRLKNFFNRTDYCDLTLQFQDKAQLKVHRLVLSACTEYFEVLERTCEMYEDCLVMPDDLQADVVVPIINFMYTGQLEFSMDLLEKLYQTSQILNMPILTKLLNSHRSPMSTKVTQPQYDHAPKKYIRRAEKPKIKKPFSTPVVLINNKRSYTKAFNKYSPNEDKVITKSSKTDVVNNYFNSSHSPVSTQASATKKVTRYDPRPTRCELPEELDTDNVFDNSFSNISYASQPLMVHPETVKRYSKSKSNDPTTSKRLEKDTTTLDIVECRKLPNDNIFEDNLSETLNDVDMYAPSYMSKQEKVKDPSQLFDQIVEQNEGPKVTFETKNSKMSSNLDHAKIISDVLKKYPHLMSNKNIKLKILNTPKLKREAQLEDISRAIKVKTEKTDEDFTYETDVIDSMHAAKLIAMGAENIKGPWICLICGTPGKALHFTSYFKFRRHLVNVHKEKPVSNICEYCGLKAVKRNYMVHHMYSQHGVAPPSHFKFPKCNQCNYIALTEGFLVKHKLTHSEWKKFRCNVCVKSYSNYQDLVTHIQATGHKYTDNKKGNLQCIYCLKVFLRDYNLYAHLKLHHRQEAKEDEIIDDSDEEQPEDKQKVQENKITFKYEEPSNSQTDYELQYEIQENPGGSIEIVSKKPPYTPKQKILNPGFTIQKQAPITVPQLSSVDENEEETEEKVMIDNIEYVIKNDQLIPRKQKECPKDDYIISDVLASNCNQNIESVVPTPSIKYNNFNNGNLEQNTQSQRVIINKQATINHPIQIVVSNEEEYKALISGNHPILFDNSNPSKTLTVLTTPNSTLATTAISMNNAPSNDMMIIPENYPITVSEATNNSNIVVVYSHPVDSQNKQYQLVTSSQGLEAQFIQSPAIISQSYETVTTNNEVMSTQVLDTAESWQNSVHETIIEQEQQAPVIDLQTIENQVDGTVRHANDETDTHLEELPEVELSHQTGDTLETPFTVETETIVNSTHCDGNVDETMQKTPDDSNLLVSLESDQPAENVANNGIEHLNVVETEQIIVNDNETIEITEEKSSLESASMIEEVQTQQNEENTLTLTEPEECLNESTSVQSDMLIENKQAEQVDIPIQEDTYVPSPTYTQEEEANVEEAIITNSISQNPKESIEETDSLDKNLGNVEIANKNIENLTSEWSDDEYDVVNENKSGDCLKNDTQNEALIIKAPLEIEESIENIQQEVNNTAVLCVSEEIDEDINIRNDNIITDIKEIESVEDNKMEVSQDEPQNKISSLLNEWEDNDSQEENTSSNEVDKIIHSEPVKQSTEKSDTCTTVAPDLKVNSEAQETKPSEANIKSLVSDWDDDDE